jgi:tRNA-5-methyluridine54 2-sulfurtransferase
VQAFAQERGASLVTVDLRERHGFDIPLAGREGSRTSCAVCGLSKRYVFNTAAREGGYDVIATGHNLDDEAATLLGNTLRWNVEYIARQSPVLPAGDGLVRKVKPLYRLSELETAAYAFLRGIDYIVEECPLVAGNTQLRYKEAMNAIESRSPGTKAQFFLGYLDRGQALFRTEQPRVDLRLCANCGEPTTAQFCAFCRARAQVLGERLGQPPADEEVAAELADEVLPVEIYAGERA